VPTGRAKTRRQWSSGHDSHELQSRAERSDSPVDRLPLRRDARKPHLILDQQPIGGVRAAGNRS